MKNYTYIVVLSICIFGVLSDPLKKTEDESYDESN
jgi:hypothetical protein